MHPRQFSLSCSRGIDWCRAAQNWGSAAGTFMSWELWLQLKVCTVGPNSCCQLPAAKPLTLVRFHLGKCEQEQGTALFLCHALSAMLGDKAAEGNHIDWHL